MCHYMGLKTIPVSLRMPTATWERIEKLADEKGLTAEMFARSVLCEKFSTVKQ